MAGGQIQFYYKNVMAEAIGPEHGISEQQFDELAKKTAPLIPAIKDEIVSGNSRYGLLPANGQIAKDVGKLVKKFKPKCENLVVLGIGGSALGNIALQTALNPYMNSLDDRQRKGARLFVFDNVDPDQLGSFLEWISDRLDRTVFNVISKSGETVPISGAQPYTSVKSIIDSLL